MYECTVHWKHLRLLFMYCSLNSSHTPPKTRENKNKKKKKKKEEEERKEQNAASHKRKSTLSAIQTSTQLVLLSAGSF